MSVALATLSTSTTTSTFMTVRNGRSVEEGAGASSPEESGVPVVSGQRYPVVGFTYDRDAARLIMLYRDPSTGDTVTQIPSELVLKQYKSAQSHEEKRADKSTFEPIVIGGDGAGSSASSGKAATVAGRLTVISGGVATTPTTSSSKAATGVNILV